MIDVLLIEKEACLEGVLTSFKEHGLVADVVKKSEDILPALEHGRYAVIVADIDTLVLYSAFWKVKLEHAKWVPVILTCHKDDFEHALFPIKQNIYDIIMKPYKTDALLKTICEAKAHYLKKERVKEIFPYTHTEVRFVVPSDTAIVGSLSLYLIEVLTLHRFEKESMDIQVAFQEGVLNAMLHGNNGDTEKKVTIAVLIMEMSVHIEIEDEGKGFDYQVPMERFKYLHNKLYAENGRGIFLISLHTDEFFYEENGKKLVLIKNRK